MKNSSIKEFIHSCIRESYEDKDRPVINHIQLLELIDNLFGRDILQKVLVSSNLLEQFSGQNTCPLPEHLLKFIEQLLSKLDIESILDPWLSTSSPLLYINDYDLKGLCYNSNQYNAIELLSTSLVVEKGNPFDLIDEEVKTYDLILSLPPFVKLNSFAKEREVSPNIFLSNYLVSESSKLLKPNGKMIVVIPDNIYIKRLGIKEIISNKELSVEAIFSLPSGTFSPYTGVSSNIIVITNQKDVYKKTFLAQVQKDYIINKKIIENFEKRIDGKNLYLGRWIDFDNLESYDNLHSMDEIVRLGKATGYKSVIFESLVLKINHLRVKNTNDVEVFENSVYIQVIGLPKVFMNLNEIKNPERTIQIVLDPYKVSSLFMFEYLNTDLGRLFLDNVSLGMSIKSINVSLLRKGLVFLPDLESQNNIISINNNIRQISTSLSELKTSLWRNPIKHSQVSKKLESLNNEEVLEDWIESLPFPVSSILWRYSATQEVSKKIEHLFHFFEALSEFLAMIMLSGLIRNPNFYDAECHNWVDKKSSKYYEKSSFGSWTILCSRLSKAIRRYYNDKEYKEFLLELYDYPNESLILMFADKYIPSTLDEVKNLRNKWKGHGGITNNFEESQRLLELERLLNILRNQVADAFYNTRIISVSKGIYEDGIFIYDNAKELVGSKTPFNEIEVHSRKPLESSKLYFYNKGQNNPIELIPFIEFKEDEGAVYYYSSVESNSVRWVSYHYDKKSEVYEDGAQNILDIFNNLNI